MKFSRRILGVLAIVAATASGAAEQSDAETTPDVPIPAGSYVPLYVKDKTPRPVQAFRLYRAPVTRRQFLEFVTSSPQWRRSRAPRIFADKSYLKDWISDLEPGGNLDAPVTYVSWFAARAYAKHLDKRLPTVDEWEFVARADEKTPDATGDPAHLQTILNWYAAPTLKVLPSAETFPQNHYGVRAMHGLIWEWNEDFNNAMVTGESRGDSGIDRNLFCAGGALTATDVGNYAAFMRYAFRSSLNGRYTGANLGFRCASDPPKPSNEEHSP